MVDIKNWIREQLKAGFSPETIKKSLIDSGYNPNLVDEVLIEVTGRKTEKNWKKISIFLGIFLSAAIVLGYFLIGPVLRNLEMSWQGAGKEEVSENESKAQGAEETIYKEISSCTNITEPGNYKLTKDLSSEGTCIMIQTDNVILDGKGHTLTGTRGARVVFGGIFIDNKSNNVIKNLKIKNYNDGIFLIDSSNNTVIGNTLTNNYAGISLLRSSNNIVKSNAVESNEEGIVLANSANNVFKDNTASSNKYNGIHIAYYSNDNKIEDNKFCDNSQFDVWIEIPASGNSGTNVCSNSRVTSGNWVICSRC